MTIHNMEVAEKFNRLADLLEIDGANPFRVRAYRNAARIVSGMGKNIADLVSEDEDLTKFPGIGKDLAEKIKIIIRTGELPLLKQTEKRLPRILSQLMQIESLGPKRVQAIYKKLKIKTMTELKTAIEKGKLRKLAGFGEKTEQKILQGIEHLKQATSRIKLASSIPIANSLINYLKECKHADHVECAGSFRRHKETVGDLDILVTAKNPEKVIEHFVKFDEIATILSQGTTRSTVILHSGIQVDLRVVPQKSYGAALLYFTGSKAHNINVRKLAVKKNLKINEYGVFKGDKQIAGKTESSVYRQVGLPYIDPALREDQGEIEAAKKRKLPTLIALDDIRGDLHAHTNLTDGDDSLEAMAKAAEALGYDYLAITDHSKHLTVAHGLNQKALLKQIKAIDKLNAKLKKLVVLKSIELDILEDGSLDLPDAILKELDLTVCSIHSKFNLSRKKQTERIMRAMDNRYFTILAHPTGRLINRRAALDIDIDRILAAAKDKKCILELNAQPERLDLNDRYCKIAKEMGIKIAISSDAHSTAQLQTMQFGIYQAERGWLSKSDVVNTRSLAALKKLFAR
ncbi:MAG: DNA polymerase III [Gammaproteobacteria bacterium RIFCSPHIGHO2_12_FULL_43_28]|nr:MAG: DNA polymerase III [Gammaproteobacteria bacterium RIFCSPHIGHO2_12_FULL_43_28]